MIQSQSQPHQIATSDIILEAMVDGVAIIDVMGNIIQGNPAFVKMYGYHTIKEMIGKKVTAIIQEDEIPRALEVIQKIINQGTAKGFRFTAITKNKEKIFVELNGTALKDSKGDTIGLLGILRDISELKKAYSSITELKKNKEKIKNK